MIAYMTPQASPGAARPDPAGVRGLPDARQPRDPACGPGPNHGCIDEVYCGYGVYTPSSSSCCIDSIEAETTLANEFVALLLKAHPRWPSPLATYRRWRSPSKRKEAEPVAVVEEASPSDAPPGPTDLVLMRFGAMLIFDDFGDALAAESFAGACRVLGKPAYVWPDQETMEKIYNAGVEVGVETGAEVFPFGLRGAVVTVQRDDDSDVEEAFERLVAGFGGSFAGT